MLPRGLSQRNGPKAAPPRILANYLVAALPAAVDEPEPVVVFLSSQPTKPTQTKRASKASFFMFVNLSSDQTYRPT